MSNIKQFFSIIIFTASIAGLFFSMAHTHSAGLECLYHFEDQHYTENELICPVCGIADFTEPVTQPTTEGFLLHEKSVKKEPLLTVQPFELLPSRAPPA